MTTLKLKAIHRILLKEMIDADGKKGHSLSELNKLNKILDKVEFTEEELRDLNLRLENGAFHWNVKKPKEEGSEEMVDIDIDKDFELSDEQAKMLYNILKEKDENKGFQRSEVGPFMDLAEQLEYEVEVD